jgi:membrane protease YdiL (CAAX protease family)
MTEPAQSPGAPEHAGAQRPGSAEYASLGRRLAAAAIDLVLIVVVLSFVAYFAAPEAASEERAYTPAEETRVGLAMLVALTIAFNYLVLSEWRWGQTLGKRALGIRVAGEGGREVTWNAALVRNLARIPDLVLALFLIVASDRRQRLGDRLGHTVVVRGEAMPATPTGVPSEPPPVQAVPATPGGEWGPMRVFGGLLALVALVIVEAGIVSAFDPDLETPAGQLSLQGMLELTLIGVAFAVARPGGGLASPGELGLRRVSPRAYGFAFLAFLAYVAFAAVYAPLVEPQQEDVTRDLGYGEGTFGSIVAGLLIVALAPFAEETFFRGFMFGGLRRRAPFAVAALVSGVVFGLVHFSGSETWGVVPQLAVLGVILAWVYERTGSLWPAIFVHVVNNAIAFAVLTSS